MNSRPKSKDLLLKSPVNLESYKIIRLTALEGNIFRNCLMMHIDTVKQELRLMSVL